MSAVLSMLVVYQQPRDYPRHVVVREQWAKNDGTIDSAFTGCLYDTFDEAMAACEALGLTFLMRHPNDDPPIRGVWL